MEKKRTIVHWVICMGLVCLIWGTYFFVEKAIQEVNIKKAICEEKVYFDYDMVADIESVSTENEDLLLCGWAMRMNANNSAINLVLQPMDAMKSEVAPAICEERKDVNEYFLGKSNSNKSGFTARIEQDKVKKDTCYEIFVVLDYEEAILVDERQSEENIRRKLATNQYLYNGELYRYNPTEFLQPNVTDEEVLTVLDEGEVRYFSDEQKLWIYQYKEKLYYILDSQFGSLKDANIAFPVMPHTSRLELLPEGKLENDHLGFFYENEDYKRDGMKHYQVAVVTIPKTYPITYINTGLYDMTEKKWIENIYLDVSYE